MFSCDYNGWADVPEEEREGIDAFEAVRSSTAGGAPASRLRSVAGLASRLLPSRISLQRKAA